ncbi:MAG: radical SAM protein [Clostridia bacterium]|nr:radical SAM protein [Clostridia bacterium]
MNISIDKYFQKNTIRIKITGQCNMNCPFCHQEGGMTDLSEICPNEQFIRIVKDMCDKYKVSDIVLTGGEPLCNQYLSDIIYELRKLKQVETIRIVTNAFLSKDLAYWKKLKDSGLNSVTISCHNIDFKDRLGNSIIQQIQNAKIIKDLNIHLKFNIVAYKDLKTLEDIYNTISTKFPNTDIVLLNELNDIAKSTTIIDKFILKNNFIAIDEPIKRKETSNILIKYTARNNKYLFRKKHNLFKHPIYCKNCQSTCREGFYGHRLEKKNNNYYLRLCLDKNERIITCVK